MNRFLFSFAVLMCLAASGCGGAGSDKGPVNENQTPQVSKEEVEKKMTQGMPDAGKQMYEKYKSGGTPRP